jgi:integrase
MSKWPKKVKHRNKVLAKIYKPCVGRESYRVSWYAAGKRQMKSFPTYTGQDGAKEFAERKVRELANNSQVALLTPLQATDALAAFECLQAHFQATGRRITLLAGISHVCDADVKLHGRNLSEAVEGYLRNVASVKRKDIGEAVTEFLQADAPRTKASNGQRAQLSAEYAYNRQIQIRRFADTFPNTAVCDLSKEHLDKFVDSLAEIKSKSRNKRKAVSAKTRNHYRAVVRQFLQWAVRKDYLPVTHRLGEADGLRPEHANTADVSFYAPRELDALLVNADDTLRPLIAIGALAGLRTAELLRLDWTDVWRVPGHIEVTKGKSKTRQRRLVEICPALAAWLEPFRTLTSGKLWNFHKITFQREFCELCETSEVEHKGEKERVTRKANGLRHAFCTYHFALHANENLTAAQAGNSPAMIHAHYKGLATRKEAENWFAIRPAKSAQNVVPLTQKMKGQ